MDEQEQTTEQEPKAGDGLPSDPEQTALLFQAVARKDAGGLQFAIARGGDARSLGPQGITPLMQAARDGWLEGIKIFLQSGLPIDAADGEGMTALMWGVKGGQIESVKALAKAGADRSLRNRDGITALSMARKSAQMSIYAFLQKVEEGGLESLPVPAASEQRPAQRPSQRPKKAKQEESGAAEVIRQAGSRLAEGRAVKFVAASAAALLVVAAVALTLAGYGPLGGRFGRLSHTDVEAAGRRTLYTAVEEISQYQAKNGFLPTDLGILGYPISKEWDYKVLSEGAYRISYTKEGQVFTYDSKQDRSVVFAKEKAARPGAKRFM